MPKPSPVLRLIFRFPTWLYRHGVGWLLGTRFLVLTHRGRRSGKAHEAVLEVAVFERGTKESVVVSAYGKTADWYRNLEANPALRVRTGRWDYAPEHRFLTPEQARTAAAEFCTRHPWEAKAVRRVLSAIGADLDKTSTSPVDLLAQLPMVALRPKT